MCKSVTPKDEQVRCSRCGIIANPTDDWETGWPMYGNMTIGNSSVIQWALMKRVDPNYSDGKKALKQTKSVVDGTHPAVKQFGYQEIQIEWGHDKKYRLCWDCQHELLSIIGEFFFKTLPKDQPIKANKNRAGITRQRKTKPVKKCAECDVGPCTPIGNGDRWVKSPTGKKLLCQTGYFQ